MQVYDQDPKLALAVLAQAKVANDKYVRDSLKSARVNGKQIGPNLYNPYNRFRVAQKKFLWIFFVG